MREIIFRGFHECEDGKTVITVDGVEKRGEWVEGYAIEKWAGKDQPRRFAIDPCLRFDETGWCSWEDDIHLVIPSTVGQFTGLCDKNGKRIFEGDIVSDGAVMYTVEFHSSAWFKRFVKDKSAYSRLHYNANCLGIIGNIFATPELLGGEE